MSAHIVKRRVRMKRFPVLALTLVVGFFASAASGAAAQFGRDDRREDGRVCLYQDDNYRGWEECYKVGDEVTGLKAGHNSQASSLRIYGRVRAIVYASDGFRGASAEFTND